VILLILELQFIHYYQTLDKVTSEMSDEGITQLVSLLQAKYDYLNVSDPEQIEKNNIKETQYQDKDFN
jgi:hypothetical protein